MTISHRRPGQRRRGGRGRQRRCRLRADRRHDRQRRVPRALPAGTSSAGNSGNDEIHGGDGPDDLYGGGGDDKDVRRRRQRQGRGRQRGRHRRRRAGTDQIYGDVAGCSVFCSFDSDAALRPRRRAGRRGLRRRRRHRAGRRPRRRRVLHAVDRPGRRAGDGPGGGPGPSGTGGGRGGARRSSSPASIKTQGTAQARPGSSSLTCPARARSPGSSAIKSKKLGSARKSLLAAGPAKLDREAVEEGQAEDPPARARAS